MSVVHCGWAWGGRHGVFCLQKHRELLCGAAGSLLVKLGNRLRWTSLRLKFNCASCVLCWLHVCHGVGGELT